MPTAVKDGGFRFSRADTAYRRHLNTCGFRPGERQGPMVRSRRVVAGVLVRALAHHLSKKTIVGMEALPADPMLALHNVSFNEGAVDAFEAKLEELELVDEAGAIDFDRHRYGLDEELYYIPDSPAITMLGGRASLSISFPLRFLGSVMLMAERLNQHPYRVCDALFDFELERQMIGGVELTEETFPLLINPNGGANGYTHIIGLFRGEEISKWYVGWGGGNTSVQSLLRFAHLKMIHDGFFGVQISFFFPVQFPGSPRVKMEWTRWLTTSDSVDAGLLSACAGERLAPLNVELEIKRA